MAVLEPGRVVLKLAGREGGRYAVVVEPEKEGFVTISGPKGITGIKRRKCSIFHVEPTEHVIKGDGWSDNALDRAWRASGLIGKLGINVPEKRKGRAAGPRPARRTGAVAKRAKPKKEEKK